MVSPQDVERAKAVPIRGVWLDLGLPEANFDKEFVSSPFREDRHPNMQVGGRENTCRDYGRNQSFDTIDLVQKVRQIDFDKAVDFLLGRNGTNQKPKTKIQKTKAADDAEAAEFLWAEYGIETQQIPDDWYVVTHEAFGKGIEYTASSPDGKIKTQKFKGLQRDEKGKRPMSIQNNNKDVALYLSKNNDVLVVTGGEEKVVVAHAAGFDAISSIHGESTPVSSAWAETLDQYGEIVLAFDHDEAGKRAEASVSNYLETLGISPFKIKKVKWPEGCKNKYDLNDAFLEGGADLVTKIVEGDDFSCIMSVSQIVSAIPDPYANMMDEYVLSKGGILGIQGPGGIGKSRLVCQLGVALILGESWCGLNTYCKGARVLYIQSENSLRRLHYDLKKMTSAMCEYDKRMVGENMFMLVPQTDVDRHVSLDASANINRLTRIVRKIKPSVVFFDPLIDFFGGDNENNNTQMWETAFKMIKIAKAESEDVAIVIVHHSKTGTDALKSAIGYSRRDFGRGASAFVNKCRAAINIVPGDIKDKGVLGIICGKNNDGKEFTERGVKLNQETMMYDPLPGFNWEKWKADVATDGFGSGNKDTGEKVNINTVMDLLPDISQYPRKNVVAYIAYHLKASEALVNRFLEVAKMDGYITESNGILEYTSQIFELVGGDDILKGDDHGETADESRNTGEKKPENMEQEQGDPA